jgi:phosphate transport system protein
VAKRSIPLAMVAPVAPAHGLKYLAKLAADSVRKVLVAYRKNDADSAYQVWQDDVHVDEAYNALFRELLTYMMEDPRSISSCTHLLFMAKNIERIGDHATNIAESVWYTAKGEPLRTPREKGDAGRRLSVASIRACRGARRARRGGRGSRRRSRRC